MCLHNFFQGREKHVKISGTQGIWILGLLDNQALKALGHPKGTKAFNALGHLGTQALEVLLGTQALTHLVT